MTAAQRKRKYDPIAGCHGKAAFSYGSAVRKAKAMRRTHDAPLVHYNCANCGRWHIGERHPWQDGQ